MMAKNKSCLKVLGKAMVGEKKKREKRKEKKPLQFSFESGPSPFCWLVPRFFPFSFQLFASQTSIVTEQQGKDFDKLSAWVSILKQKREKKRQDVSSFAAKKIALLNDDVEEIENNASPSAQAHASRCLSFFCSSTPVTPTTLTFFVVVEKVKARIVRQRRRRRRRKEGNTNQPCTTEKKKVSSRKKHTLSFSYQAGPPSFFLSEVA